MDPPSWPRAAVLNFTSEWRESSSHSILKVTIPRDDPGLESFSGVQYLNNQNYRTCVRAERDACFVELQADANHFMLEPVDAGDMKAERKKEERERMVNEAMGMGFFSPPAPRKRKKKYGRPNAKVER